MYDVQYQLLNIQEAANQVVQKICIYLFVVYKGRLPSTKT